MSNKYVKFIRDRNCKNSLRFTGTNNPFEDSEFDNYIIGLTIELNVTYNFHELVSYLMKKNEIGRFQAVDLVLSKSRELKHKYNEHRYIHPIFLGLLDEGLKIKANKNTLIISSK